MRIRIDATTLVEELVADNDPQYLHVGAADLSGMKYLTLQRSLPVGDNEDWGVYIEVNDQAHSGYDCISTCVVSGEGMTVNLAKPLDAGGQIEGIDVHLGSAPSPTSFLNVS